MQKMGELGSSDLAALADIPAGNGESLSFTTRMFDGDGDGQGDLFLIDKDNDGVVDGIVRGFDADGDGINDLYAHYDADGTLTSVGRINPESGEMELLHEETDLLDDLLESLGFGDNEPVDTGLFTRLDDPYLQETFGSFGEEVPDLPHIVLVAEPDDLFDSDDSIPEMEGVIVMNDVDDASPADQADFALEQERSAEEPDSVNLDAPSASADEGTSEARVVELSDTGGGVDGTTLWARIDTDGDGLWDQETLASKSGSAWLSDIDHDGYAEEIATDMDNDGRIDSVNTTGHGSSSDTVDPSRVIAADSEEFIDRHPGEDDTTAEASPDAEAGDDWQMVDDNTGEESGDLAWDADNAADYSSDNESASVTEDGAAEYPEPEPCDYGGTTDATDSTE
jgi:hypothetical protein